MKIGALVLIGLFAGASPSEAVVTIINSTVESADGANATTTDAMSTLGASLLVVTASWYGADTELPAALSDSAANTWICLAGAGQGPTQLNLCYVNSATPTTSAVHTVTFAATGTYAAVSFLAASGTAVVPLDLQNSGNDTNVTALAVNGGITPTVSNALVVTGASVLPTSGAIAGPATYTLIGGATVTPVGAVTMGGGGAYRIQTTAVATDPSWSWSTPTDAATMVVSFKELVGGGGSGGPCTLATTGAGRC
jgi:hypothetical protein